jgi:hypothetical protein
MKDLNIKTKDNAKLTDKLSTYKKWFNGVKHFFTVKSIPPKP